MEEVVKNVVPAAVAAYDTAVPVEDSAPETNNDFLVLHATGSDCRIICFDDWHPYCLALALSV